MHPDKNKEANATEVFRSISKAFEVLSGNESRPLFDYYLKYPKVRSEVLNIPKIFLNDVMIFVGVGLF